MRRGDKGIVESQIRCVGGWSVSCPFATDTRQVNRQTYYASTLLDLTATWAELLSLGKWVLFVFVGSECPKSEIFEMLWLDGVFFWQFFLVAKVQRPKSHSSINYL